MRHFGALVLKFIIIAAVLELVLWNLTPLTFANILGISVVLTLAAYFIGDLGILPRSNNTVATVADFGLTFVTLWLSNYVFYGTPISFSDALLASVGVGIGEAIFHRFVSRTVLAQRL